MRFGRLRASFLAAIITDIGGFSGVRFWLLLASKVPHS